MVIFIHKATEFSCFSVSLSGEYIVAGCARLETETAEAWKSNLMILSFKEEAFVCKKFISLPDKSFGVPTFVKRIKDTNLLIVGGFQSMFVGQLIESSNKASLSDFFYIRQIHSNEISDLVMVGDSIFTCCAKDKFISEIKIDTLN